MPKVSDEHRAARREQITAAALACFARKGFQRTSMADIVAESGLSPGAIYLHFESKQAIVTAVAEGVIARRMGQIDEHRRAGADLDPPDLLRALVAGLDSDLHDTRILLQLWSEATVDAELAHLVGTVFGTVRGVLVGYLATWAAERHGLVDTAARAWADRVLPAFMAMMMGFVTQRALFPAFDSDAYFAAVRELLAPPTAGSSAPSAPAPSSPRPPDSRR